MMEMEWLSIPAVSFAANNSRLRKIPTAPERTPYWRLTSGRSVFSQSGINNLDKSVIIVKNSSLVNHSFSKELIPH
jgi:hypothetical protein